MEGYAWLRTVKQNRDEGFSHLCREEARVYDDGTPYISAGEPVCGARPWAYRGLDEEGTSHRCGMCRRLEEKLKEKGELT